MARKSPESSQLRQQVLDQNVFIQASPTLASTPEVLTFLENLPKKFIDFEKIYSVLSVVILEDPDGWKPINPNFELIQAADEAEIRRVSIEISKRKFQMQTALQEDVAFTDVDGKLAMTFRGEEIKRQNSILVDMLRQSRVTQDLIWGWTRSLAEDQGGVLAVGEDKKRVNKKSFTTYEAPVNGSVTEDELNAISWSVLRQLARKSKLSIELSEEQAGIEIQRDQFVWASNPLISEFRTIARPIVLEHLADYRKFGVTEFDLVTQVMMHLSINEPTQVWLGNDDVVGQVVDLISQERGAEAEKLFTQTLESGDIRLNEELAHYECERQVIKLANHYQTLAVDIGGESVKLPAPYMGDPNLNPFKDFERTEVSAKNRQYEIDPNTGEKIMIAVEKYSGRRIIFKSVRPEISYLYSVGFSNLHYPRSGETHVFGAYLDGDELPFAYSSYTPVIRTYSRNMLTHLGANPSNIMESARAWNSSWAPENTMSLLFTFAHEMMREDRDAEIKSGTQEDALEGVFTSINPNLGFKAVSFRGVRFNVGGVKPTGFSYLRNSEGSADFMPKGEIKKQLRIESDEELQAHPDFLSNTIPFLSTLEMVTLFDKDEEEDLLSRPIYRVTQEAFNQG